MAKFLDVEGAVRSWLRTQLPDLSGRVFFGIPAKSPILPLVTLQRIGGAPQFGESPLEDIRLSFDVWGLIKEDAINTLTALSEVITDIANVTMPLGVHCCYAKVDSVLWRPDDEKKLARYVADATFTVKPQVFTTV